VRDAGAASAFPVEFPNEWLRLKRHGNTFTGYVSRDGVSWKEYGSQVVDLPQDILLGLAVTAHTNDVPITAVFGELKALPPG
jgi:hypothetical protein